MRLLLLALSLLVVGLGYTTPLYAQLDESAVSLTLSPEIPNPGALVTAKIISFSIDLDRSNITWTLNGVRSLQGVGEKTFSFTNGAVGASTRISVSISSTAGTITKSITINPSEVDLIWEVVDGYTPAFYRGKTLPASEVTVRVLAIPNIRSGGVKISPSQLVYEWRRNGKREQTSSGYGRDTLRFKSGYTSAEEIIEVVVTSTSGASATKKIYFTIGEPELLLYEDKPLEGVHYEEALPERVTLSEEELSLIAEPYFFSGGKRRLSYEWLVSGERASPNPQNSSLMSLRAGAGGGVAELYLSVSHLTKLLQSKERGIFIKFGNQ